MRVLRIFLQVVIVAFGASGVAVLVASPRREWLGAIVFLGATAFLLALTFALKEQTETRLERGRVLNHWPMGVAILLLGLFGLFLGASYLFGMQALPDGSGRCRSVCRLILVVTEWYGEIAGRLVAFALWAGMGALLSFFGYHLARIGRPT